PLYSIAGHTFILLWYSLLLPRHFFFFYLHLRHRDLHSFPTRRSSDLGVQPGDTIVQAAGVQVVCGLDLERALLDRPTNEALQVQDRKSTRLNSSHLVISYAVFCLKKKNISLMDHLTGLPPLRDVRIPN